MHSTRLSSFNSSVPASLFNRFACLRGSIELRGIRELSVGLILGGDAGKRHNMGYWSDEWKAARTWWEWKTSWSPSWTLQWVDEDMEQMWEIFMYERHCRPDTRRMEVIEETLLITPRQSPERERFHPVRASNQSKWEGYHLDKSWVLLLTTTEHVSMGVCSMALAELWS